MSNVRQRSCDNWPPALSVRTGEQASGQATVGRVKRRQAEPTSCEARSHEPPPPPPPRLLASPRHAQKAARWRHFRAAVSHRDTLTGGERARAPSLVTCWSAVLFAGRAPARREPLCTLPLPSRYVACRPADKHIGKARCNGSATSAGRPAGRTSCEPCTFISS